MRLFGAITHIKLAMADGSKPAEKHGAAEQKSKVLGELRWKKKPREQLSGGFFTTVAQ